MLGERADAGTRRRRSPCGSLRYAADCSSMAADEIEMRARVGEILNRWPSAGLAVGVVRDGSLAWFHGHGVADIRSGTPVDEHTVFRIASITKTITAVAVMQLWEQGLVDLDAPANDYLRAYRLVPAKATFGPATVRQLLTHTAGVRAVRTALDVLRPALGWGARVGRPARRWPTTTVAACVSMSSRAPAGSALSPTSRQGARAVRGRRWSEANARHEGSLPPPRVDTAPPLYKTRR